METEELRKAKLGINLVAGILALIGFIFLFMMVTDILEFTEYINYLESQYGSYVMNDPAVQEAIAQGYWELAKDKLVVIVPVFIGAIVVKAAGTKAVEKKLIVDETIRTVGWIEINRIREPNSVQNFFFDILFNIFS